MYLYLFLALATVFCAAKAISAKCLLTAALWLAGTSALVSSILYLLGAFEVAVVELSVGAGLVTILFVFAISIAGEEGMEKRSGLPRWLTWSTVLVVLALLGRQALPLAGGGEAFELPFALVLWEQRSLDALLLIAVILAGVVTALGLLSEGRRSPAHRKADAPVDDAASGKEVCG